jgi:hypothetical protein
MSNEDIEIWRGDDYRVVLDGIDEGRIIKKPRPDSGHAVQEQARYDTRVLSNFFPKNITGDTTFHATGTGDKDFYLKQTKTQGRVPMTLDVLRDHKARFLDILACNEEMRWERWVSLDFFWFLCCRPEVWGPIWDTLLSNNLSVSADRWLIVEDTGLLHVRRNTDVQLSPKRRLLYTIHHRIERVLITQILKKI